jgi:hypothetical protein
MARFAGCVVSAHQIVGDVPDARFPDMGDVTIRLRTATDPGACVEQNVNASYHGIMYRSVTSAFGDALERALTQRTDKSGNYAI